jgi:hypothetical protein
LSRLAIEIPGVAGSYWRTGIVKSIVFCGCYFLVIFALERRELPMLLAYLKMFLPGRNAPPNIITGPQK